MPEQIKKLPGNYVAGFVDGEGCFALKFRRDQKQNKRNKKIRNYFYWGVELAIVLRGDDYRILELIQGTLGCGKIHKTHYKQIRFSVQNPREIYEKILPFFIKYKLRAKKAGDFKLWSEAVEIIQKYRRGPINAEKGKQGFIKKEIPQKDLARLTEIRNKMLNFKSKRGQSFKWGAGVKA